MVSSKNTYAKSKYSEAIVVGGVKILLSTISEIARTNAQAPPVKHSALNSSTFSNAILAVQVISWSL